MTAFPYSALAQTHTPRSFFVAHAEKKTAATLGPYEKFAAMIDRHWDGIAAYCRPENKVALGFVEG